MGAGKVTHRSRRGNRKDRTSTCSVAPVPWPRADADALAESHQPETLTSIVRKGVHSMPGFPRA